MWRGSQAYSVASLTGLFFFSVLLSQQTAVVKVNKYTAGMACNRIRFSSGLQKHCNKLEESLRRFYPQNAPGAFLREAAKENWSRKVERSGRSFDVWRDKIRTWKNQSIEFICCIVLAFKQAHKIFWIDRRFFSHSFSLTMIVEAYPTAKELADMGIFCAPSSKFCVFSFPCVCSTLHAHWLSELCVPRLQCKLLFPPFLLFARALCH